MRRERRHFLGGILPHERKPVEWTQLCAIARDVRTSGPAIDDFEWREQIKGRIVALGLTYPARPEMLGEAQDAVQHALERDGLRRELPTASAVPVRADDVSISRDEAAALVARLQGHRAIKPMPAVAPLAPRAVVLTLHAAAKQKALRMVAAEIAASIARCEELERVVAEEPELVT